MQGAACEICNDGGNGNALLLCNGCEKGAHTFCLTPPLAAVPDDDWFCEQCKACATDPSVATALGIAAALSDDGARLLVV